ncbi:MAG TPA: adenylyltransferase/cytidyltransferase family protein, partial [Thermoanaerobaculia bacterium]|nr:adenylyltransferase/cytidyltransferase family protein [Thermoanaerobaculia bacterium]
MSPEKQAENQTTGTSAAARPANADESTGTSPGTSFSARVGEVILDHDALERRLGELRAAGRRVAFANGHFDVLHVGHLRYLTAARETADALLVALNDDASVERLKGPGRPLVPAAERAELLAALAPVDLVTVFSGDSPAPLLARLRPDVHCKGTDYGTPERVPEYETVRAYGGETRLVG